MSNRTMQLQAGSVALLAEGVDRNNTGDLIPVYLDEVALLAEGVDRNSNRPVFSSNFARSPSSRRAWIEIGCNYDVHSLMPVALLAEGVDRNQLGFFEIAVYLWSPSSRRAWIEIEKKQKQQKLR